MLLSARLVRRARAYRRPALYFFAAVLFLDALRILGRRSATVRADLADASVRRPSVFIVSVHRNTETILRAAWSASILGLADYLGHDNVFVSAVESGSQDGTKAALTELEGQLAARGIAHDVRLGPTVWEQLDELSAGPPAGTPRDERPGWIWHAAEDRFALRRIPYLARVRNEAMAPLLRQAKTKTYDYVLWVNDVAFDTADVVTLLQTRGGHFAAACAMDFMAYPYYYDTFALRDEHGDKAVSDQWPWFRAPDARAAVQAGRAVRVQSCWNGLVAFDARPFYGFYGRASTTQKKDKNGLLFRGVDDSLAELHLEASECCLVHADNPLSHFGEAISDAQAHDSVGVWLNPNVRVAYSAGVYETLRRLHHGVFPGAWAAVRGTWANRVERARSTVQFALESQTVLKRLRQWRADAPAGTERHEPGAVCLINEMQIMWQNGWKHL